MRLSLTRLAAAAAITTAFAPAAFAAPTVTLPVEYRDFLYSGTAAGTYGGSTGVGHPDFQNGCCGLVTGMVASNLSGGVPVYVGSSGYGFVQSAGSFDQWYRDVAGVNTRIDSTLTLTNISGNTYQYSSNSFFPIDGQGFNSGGFQTDNGHNFGFTMHMGWNGAVTALGQQFTFIGDDDVWVFANGKLFMDLGGVHGATASTVNGAGILAAAGVGLGSDIHFDLFFAERHTVASDFTLTTDIIPRGTPVPEPTSLALLGLGLAGVGLSRKRTR